MTGAPFAGFADWATDFIEFTGYVGVGALVALANVLPPLPVEVVLLVGGFVSGQEYGLWLPGVVAAATAGSVVGALVPYALGCWFGEQRLRRFVGRFGWVVLLKEADLDRANRWFDRHEGKAIFISRMVPGVEKPPRSRPVSPACR